MNGTFNRLVYRFAHQLGKFNHGKFMRFLIGFRLLNDFNGSSEIFREMIFNKWLLSERRYYSGPKIEYPFGVIKIYKNVDRYLKPHFQKFLSMLSEWILVASESSKIWRWRFSNNKISNPVTGYGQNLWNGMGEKKFIIYLKFIINIEFSKPQRLLA